MIYIFNFRQFPVAYGQDTLKGEAPSLRVDR